MVHGGYMKGLVQAFGVVALRRPRPRSLAPWSSLWGAGSRSWTFFVFILFFLMFFFFCDFQGIFGAIFDSRDILHLFANFFLDLLILEGADLWLEFRFDPLRFD